MAINNILKSIVLDVYDHDIKTPKTIKAIAADNDVRYIAAEIQNEGVRYDVSASSTVELIILRPDKVGVSIVGQPQEFTYQGPDIFDTDTGETTPGETITYYGVYAELDQAALAKSGTLLGQFKITSGEQILRTELFKVNNGRALDAETSDWAGEYQGYNLDELVETVNSTAANVTAMQSELQTAEGRIDALEQGGAGGGSPFDMPTATNLITILRNCVFTKDVSIAINNLAEALGVNSGGDDDDMTFTYGQSIPKGNTARTLELTGMSISLTEIRLVVALHSDFAQGGFCWVQVPNRGTPYVGVDGNGDFYYSNENAYPGSFSATPSNLSDFVDTIKEVRIIWLNPSGWESQKYLSGFKFFFNGYNPSCGYTLYRCSGFNGSTEVFRLESSGTNGELYDVLTGTTYTFNNTTGMEIVEVSE